jgi:zinc protease
VEIDKELRGVINDHPITAEELEKVQKQRTLELAGQWETMGAIAGSVDEIVRYQLPDDYYQTYADKIRALGLEKVSTAAQKLIHPRQLTWVVVGDRSKVESEIRELGISDVKRIDTDGQPIE